MVFAKERGPQEDLDQLLAKLIFFVIEQRIVAENSQRVAEGGHHVPPDRILQRYPRTMANLKTAVRLADLTFVFDAVESEQGAHRLVALCELEQTTMVADNPPIWVTAMLAKS